MDEKEFERLIERYQQGLLPPGEAKIIQEWLETMSNEGAVLWNHNDKDNLKSRILAKIRNHSALQLNKQEHSKSFSLISIRNLGWRSAAVILILVGLAYVSWQYTAKNFPRNVVVTAHLGARKIILPDESIVWLKEGGTLSYSEKFTTNIRKVSLEGEALFEVTKDPSRPFEIHTKDLKTTVLGTSFNINANKDSVEVVVLTGKVKLTLNDNSNEMTLLPSEKGVFKRMDRLMVKSTVPEHEKISKTSNTSYAMVFEQASMGKIIEAVKGKFNVDVSLSNTKINDCLITADFTGQSLDETLELLSLSLNLSYDIEAEQRIVKLVGEGCN